MLLENTINAENNAEICWFYTTKQNDIDLYMLPNVIKTIYHYDMEHLQIFFVKERNVTDAKTKQITRKILITVYFVKNIDKTLYDNFKSNDSQGNFYNSYISKRKDSLVRSKFQLEDDEVDDIAKEWENLMYKNNFKTVLTF